MDENHKPPRRDIVLGVGNRPGALLARALMRKALEAEALAAQETEKRTSDAPGPEYDSRQVGRAMRRAAAKYRRRR